jgi:outer membrane protein OmpA-like peptidoglycan-associated protein
MTMSSMFPPAPVFAITVMMALSTSALASPTLTAREPTVEQMICALDPQCKTPFLDPRLRDVSAGPTVHALGSFDRRVNFAFDSAELTVEARGELYEVAKCLADPRLINVSIVINGHTDGVGTIEYNLGLSERRAEAVRQYLITQYGIDPSRLAAKGYGKSQLLLPSDPTNSLNRRVSFLNTNYTTPSTPQPSQWVPSQDGL